MGTKRWVAYAYDNIMPAAGGFVTNWFTGSALQLTVLRSIAYVRCTVTGEGSGTLPWGRLNQYNTPIFAWGVFPTSGAGAPLDGAFNESKDWIGHVLCPLSIPNQILSGVDEYQVWQSGPAIDGPFESKGQRIMTADESFFIYTGFQDSGGGFVVPGMMWHYHLRVLLEDND